jgi:hypothetical protein
MNIDEFLESQADDMPKEQEADIGVTAKASNSVRDKIAKIQSLIAEKKFEEASTLFSTLREEYTRLIEMQDKERADIQNEMQKISTDIMSRLNKLSDEVDKRAEIIRKLLEKAEMQLSISDFIGANQSYASMREILAGMPDGFAERRSQLEGDILAFYIKFKDKYTNTQKAKFDSLIQQVTAIIDQAENAANLGNRPEAERLLSLAKSAFEKLPTGFLHDKAGLHNRITELMNSLSKPGFSFKQDIPRPEPPKKKLFGW